MEAIRYLLKKKLIWGMVGDSITNFVTFYAVLGIIIATATAYVGGYYYVHENFAVANLPINGWTISICIVLADFPAHRSRRQTPQAG